MDAGVDNIIKNEVLFRIRLHPLPGVGARCQHEWREVVQRARVCAFAVLAWNNAHVSATHCPAHHRGRRPRHDIPLQHMHPGKTHRRSFFCTRCQKLMRED